MITKEGWNLITISATYNSIICLKILIHLGGLDILQLENI